MTDASTSNAVIVTGATSGIGAATTRLLLDNGYAVVGVARRRAQAAEINHRNWAFVDGDVRDPDTARRAVDASRGLGRLWGLVNNAGIDHVRPLLNTSTIELRDVMDVNFFGALTMLVAAATEMTAHGGGSIVNVTSRLARVGVPTMGGYGATKGALAALTRHAAVELAPLGVRVNDVAPGFTATQLLEDYIAASADPGEIRTTVAQGIPQGRVATPDEVAEPIMFLISDRSSHVTGISVAVDGGYTAA